MDCRTTSTYKFSARLGFKQYDLILTNEQSVLSQIYARITFKTARINL